MNETDRLNVLDFTTKIIEAQETANLKELTLNRLGSTSVEELTDEDMRLINAVVQLEVTQLSKLELYMLNAWFAHSEERDQLLDFIRGQTCLEKLELDYCRFDSATTKLVLSCLLNSSNLETVSLLSLTGSCDFSDDETCALVAQLISTAPKLEQCNINE